MAPIEAQAVSRRPDPSGVGEIAEMKRIAECANPPRYPDSTPRHPLGLVVLERVETTLRTTPLHRFRVLDGDPTWWYDFVLGAPEDVAFFDCGTPTGT